MWMGYLYTPIELFILLKLINTSYHKQFSHQSILNFCFGFAFFCVVDYYMLEGNGKFNSYGRGVECIIMVTASLYYFVDLMLNKTDLFIQRTTLFWVSAGTLFYFTGNLVLFLLMNYTIYHPNVLPRSVWVLHSVFNIVFNLFLTHAILCSRRTTN